MHCKNCGKELPDRTLVCTGCGAETFSAAPPKKKKRKPSAGKMMRQGEKVTENIYLCEDGKYRWVYELSILKNPTIFILVWKILFFILVGIFTFTMIFDAIEWNDFFPDRFLVNLRMFAYFVIGMTVLTILALLLYAAIMGGKYCVMFEMDEYGVTHKQMPKQAKKAEIISLLTALAGLASRNMTTVGIGLSSARTSMSSEFAKVRSVKAYPRRDLIKVNERFMKNQVYAEPSDYDFVYSYIREHVSLNKQEDR